MLWIFNNIEFYLFDTDEDWYYYYNQKVIPSSQNHDPSHRFNIFINIFVRESRTLRCYMGGLIFFYLSTLYHVFNSLY